VGFLEKMLSELLLPDLAGLRLDALDFGGPGGFITVVVTSTQQEVRCPECAQASQHVHSQYQRTVADLPCAGRTVRFELTVRKLFCHNDECRRVVFTERLPGVVAPWARRTVRLADEQRRIGYDLGGEAGARLGVRQGMVASADTLLRLVRGAPTVEQVTPRVLGVDDWARRKGHTYGTILVDLEAHKVVDLLPDRSPETLEKWLQDHPGVEIISRDRANAYADGSSRAAPEAIQVADRFHLLQNVREALERLLDRNQARLHAATKLEAVSDTRPSASEPQVATVSTSEPPHPEPVAPSASLEPTTAGTEQAHSGRRTRRQVRYEHVMALRRQGVGIRAIASQLCMSRRTVHRYIRADSFPETARRRKVRSILDPYKAYLQQQIVAGRDNGMQLWREIREQGYLGSRVLVSRWVVQHRHLCPVDKGSEQAAKRRARPPAPPCPGATPRPLSARQGSWLLVTQPGKLTDEERMKVTRLCQASSDVAGGCDLGQGFARMVRGQEVDSLDAWLSKAKGSGLPDFERFATGIERDRAAVAAALSLPWSNGQTEGQVNRLKLIKRQMYGRANFDLLRQRVLAA
jgi:transposase